MRALPLRRRRRVHRHAARRQPARRLHRRARPRPADDAGARAGDELRRDACSCSRRASADADVRIRIFTPRSELPFAGHPVLGSAFVLGGAAAEDRDPARDRRRRRSRSRSSARARGSASAGWSSRSRPGSRSPRTGELLAALGVERSGLPVELYDLGPAPRLRRARLARGGGGARARPRRARAA